MNTVDEITHNNNGIVCIRLSTNEGKYIRLTILPGQNPSEVLYNLQEPNGWDEVETYCSTLHTPEIIEAFQVISAKDFRDRT